MWLIHPVAIRVSISVQIMLKTTTIHVTPLSGGATKVEMFVLRAVVVAVASTFASSMPSEELDADRGLQVSVPPPGVAEEKGDDLLARVLASGEGKVVSLLESLLASLNVLLSEFGLPATSVVCAALAVTILAFVIIRKAGGADGGVGTSSTKRRVVLFLGPCGSGKTAMMHRLCHDRIVPTVTSMQSCTYLLTNDRASKSRPPVPLTDYPGHERLRGGLSQELHRAERVVFILDGSCLASQITAGAELLYDILSDPSMEGCRGLLIALNKSDLKEAKPARAKTLLQKEIEKLRSTRGTLGTQGEEDNLPHGLALGRPGQPFNLEIDSPCEVIMATCSAKDGTLESVRDFILSSTR